MYKDVLTRTKPRQLGNILRNLKKLLAYTLAPS